MMHSVVFHWAKKLGGRWMIQGEPTLTIRELQILKAVAEGFSAKEAAQNLGIAPRTVECHLDTMRLKLRARNQTHMVAIAMELGVLPDFSFSLSRR